MPDPRRLPDRSSDETWHDSYAHATAGHDKYLDEFAFPFKVLRHHQGGTIPGHAHANTWKIRDYHVTERDVTGRSTHGLCPVSDQVHDNTIIITYTWTVGEHDKPRVFKQQNVIYIHVYAVYVYQLPGDDELHVRLK